MKTISIRPVGPRNQVTIPAEMLKKLNIHTHDLVTFVITENGLLMKPVEVVDKKDIFEKSELHAIERIIEKQTKTEDFKKFDDSGKALSFLKKRVKCK